ncbi:MAG: ATP-binding protein [Desulfuromusa sp.]|nr:ATP-binding protein [Desulfuromusa sp.]
MISNSIHSGFLYVAFGTFVQSNPTLLGILRLGILLDREMAVRQTRKINTRLRKAKLRQNSYIEDIDFRHPRDLDKSLVMRLAGCEWVKERNNLIITGPTGVG